MQNGNGLYNSSTYIEDLRAAAEHVIGADKLDDRRVLVTGASGTIGSFIVDMLLVCTRANVVACGRNPEKLKDRFAGVSDIGSTDDADLEQVDRLEVVQYDLLGLDSTEHLPTGEVDYIIHAAGNAYPSAFVGRSDDTVKGNILGTRALLEYGMSHGCRRFIYVSTGEVYSLDEDFRKSLLRDYEEKDFSEYYELVCREVAERGPRSSYPVSKAATEAMCLGFGLVDKLSDQEHDMAVLVARPCHTFGPGITGGDDRAHVQFVKKAIAGEDIVMNSAGSQLRSYNYVADTASGIVSLLGCEYGGADASNTADGLRFISQRIFDICSRGNEITIRGLADMIASRGGVSVVIKEADDKEKKLLSPINRQVLDPSHLESIGWGKAYDLEKAIAHYVDVLLGK